MGVMVSVPPYTIYERVSDGKTVFEVSRYGFSIGYIEPINGTYGKTPERWRRVGGKRIHNTALSACKELDRQYRRHIGKFFWWWT